MSRYGYVHTIDGKPARFDGYQICYVDKHWPAVPVPDLASIYRERQATIINRERDGLDSASNYSHFRVLLE